MLSSPHHEAAIVDNYRSYPIVGHLVTVTPRASDVHQRQSDEGQSLTMQFSILYMVSVHS